MKYSHPTQIPRSNYFSSLEWTGERIGSTGDMVRGDTYPVTWADNNELYIGAGDPNCFEKDGEQVLAEQLSSQDAECYYEHYTGLVVEKITGNSQNFKVERINDMVGYSGWGGRGAKPTGMICVDGILYCAVQNLLGGKPPRHGTHSQHGSDATIIKSTDYGKTWTPELGEILTAMENEMAVRNAPPDRNGDRYYWTAPVEMRSNYKGWTPMFPGNLFGGPSFVQFGKNNEDAIDEYVYAVSSDQWDNGTELRLGRVPKSDILNQLAWEYAVPQTDGVKWEKDIHYSEPILAIDRHVGVPEMIYLPLENKYLLATWALHTDFYPNDGSELTILEANHPWGPFSLVHYEWMWYKEEAGCYCPRFPLKWFHHETLSGNMLFSGNWIDQQVYYRTQIMPFKLNLKKSKRGAL